MIVRAPQNSVAVRPSPVAVRPSPVAVRQSTVRNRTQREVSRSPRLRPDSTEMPAEI